MSNINLQNPSTGVWEPIPIDADKLGGKPPSYYAKATDLVGIAGYKMAGSANFNSTTGTTINHSIGNTNYRVLVTPIGNPNGFLGEFWVEKANNSFTVKCSGTATTAFDYVIF